MNDYILNDPNVILPSDREWVLALFNDRPWISAGEPTKHKWVVVEFRKGISEKERSLLPDTDPRKISYHASDEHSNNLVPYNWDTFGPGSFFGQECTCWTHLPSNALSESL